MNARAPWQFPLLIGGIALVGLNLRPAITALAPLALRMEESGLSRAAIGNLTTLALMLFGVVGFFAGPLGNRYGLARTMGVGLLFIAVGSVWRSAPEPLREWNLWAGTVLIGAGIALGNVLLPGLVKSRFPQHLGPMTSFYATALNLGAAFGLLCTLPLLRSLSPQAGGEEGGWQDWEMALALWGGFAFLAFLLWLPQMGARPKRSTEEGRGRGALFRQRRTWQVTGFMGLQSLLFYSSVAWLPALLQSRGLGENEAANWTALMQVVGCVGSVVIPVLAARARQQSGWIVFCCAFNVVGLVGILWGPLGWVGGFLLALGMGLNGAFALSLLVITLRSSTPAMAAELSSLAQAVGYLLAAPGPYLVGLLSAQSGGWALPWALLVGVTVLTAVFGWGSGRGGELRAN